jgi:hypothetical protein
MHTTIPEWETVAPQTMRQQFRHNPLLTRDSYPTNTGPRQHNWSMPSDISEVAASNELSNKNQEWSAPCCGASCTSQGWHKLFHFLCSRNWIFEILLFRWASGSELNPYCGHNRNSLIFLYFKTSHDRRVSLYFDILLTYLVIPNEYLYQLGSSILFWMEALYHAYLNVIDEGLKFLLHIWEILGLIFSPDTSYTDWSFCGFSQSLQRMLI